MNLLLTFLLFLWSEPLTSLVISSSNEDSDFSHNYWKITKRKKHIGKRKFVFLINNLLDYLGRELLFVSIYLFFEKPAKK